MARWTVTPGTANNTMSGQIKYDGIGENSYWEIQQDVEHILKEVKRDKDLLSTGRGAANGMRKMCTIPDIVAIRILTDHNLDLHDPMFMENPANMTKLKKILKSEYPDLLIAT